MNPILLVEPNFFAALELKRRIISDNPQVKDSDIVWANSIESAKLLLSNVTYTFSKVLIHGKVANSKLLVELGLFPKSITQSRLTESKKNGSTTMNPTMNSNPVAGFCKVAQDTDSLSVRLLDLKSNFDRRADGWDNEIEKIEVMLFNATGGGLMSRVEKMSFNVEDLNDKTNDLSKAVKELEDFKYQTILVLNQIKEERQSSSFKSSKLWEIKWLFLVGIVTAIITFGLGQLSSPIQSQRSHPVQHEVKATVGR